MIQFELVRGLIKYIGEVRRELTHVVWPTRNETIRLTLIVLVLSGIIGAYVGGLDYLYTKAVTLILTK